MSPSCPPPLNLLSILFAAALLAGCGDEDRPGDPSGTVTVPDVAVERHEERDPEEDADVVPGPAAIAQGRRFEALVAAYAPVSARVSFLVTAETLRRDAAESGAGVDVELERTGAVRVEVNRMRGLLRATRPRVADVPLTTDVQRRVQRHMLDAIDARVRSLAQLDAALDAVASELPDRVVEERFEAWRSSWDASLRAARTATTVMQGARAHLGLVPAPEESVR